MMEPDSGLVRLSPAQLTRIRRGAGDHSDRTLIEACAIGLAYWATGRGPAGTDLTPGTPFTDVLGLVTNGVMSPRGWEADADARSVTVPKGVDRTEAQLVLDDLADFPDRPIGTLAQGGAARLEALAGWNETRADRVRPTVMELFREQARLRPDAVAIVDEQRSLTYREAADRSAQLAHHLIERGHGPEQVVGISQGRSAEMVIGL
ncbi:AMP-binding protein, partial [Streptomyces sp. SID7499]|nr:AMP-binding protein [Streptomyces sp. SID7499]